MGEQKINKRLYGEYTISLINSVFNNSSPSAVPEGIDLDELFEFTRAHNIENIVYLALAGLGIDNINKFEDAYNHAISYDATQGYYLELIEDEFERNRILHLPMKGAILKKLYPSSDLRKSGDLDIYFKNEDSERVKAVMMKLGFDIVEYGESKMHDKYLIDKKIEVEMHRSLMIKKLSVWASVCSDIENNLQKDEGYEYRYHMTDEDYYLYMVTHMAKHMKYGGIGMRFILDIWVYLKEYNDKLNWAYIEHQLKKGQLDKFEQLTRRLSDVWFNHVPSDDMLDKLGYYIMRNGVFGSVEQYVLSEYAENNLKNGQKSLKMYVQAFFLPYDMMKDKYPILARLPFLLPFCWIHRGINVCVFKKEKVIDFTHRYDNIDKTEADAMAEFKQAIGL